MYNFTNEYVPNCVNKDCFTCFYEGTVCEILKLKNNKIAPIYEWDLFNNPCVIINSYIYGINGIPCIEYDTDSNNYFTDRDNKIVIIKITKIPTNEKEKKNCYLKQF